MGDAAGEGGAKRGRPPESRRLKLFSIDALRGFLLLNVVLGHAAVSFGVNTPSGWIANDRSRSYLVHPFENFLFDAWGATLFSIAIPTFFILAGLYAMVLLRRVGAGGFVANRLKLIVVPFLVALALINPLTYVVGLYGKSWNAAPGAPEGDFTGAVVQYFTSTELIRGLAPYHLWFLYYLIVVYALFVVTMPAWNPLFRSPRFRRVARRMLSSPLRAFVLGAVTFLPTLFMDLFIDTPTGFVPERDIVAFYFLFFLIGALLARQPVLLPLFWQRWKSNVAVALLIMLPLAMSLGALSLASGTVDNAIMRSVQLPPPIAALVERLPAATSLAVAAPVLMKYVLGVYTWMLIFGLMGFFQRFFGKPYAVVRYLVDSSYWVYLVHFPLVLYLQVVVQDVQIPAMVKYLVVSTASLGILLLSYELLVRRTPLGLAIGGSPRPRRRAREA